MSALDLCAAATEAEGLGCFREEHADKALSQVLSDGQIPHDWWKSKAHEDLWRSKEARNRFVDCLLWFFRFKHHEDSLPENRKRRDYLRDLLAKLDGGDVVVTLNWDTTVERTLAEEGRWNPLTGYGFEKDLQTGERDALEALPAGFPKKSEITVLKLHGSLSSRIVIRVFPGVGVTAGPRRALLKSYCLFICVSLVLRPLSARGLAGRNDSDAIAPSRVNNHENPSNRPDANRYEALLFRFVVRHRQHGVVLEHGHFGEANFMFLQVARGLVRVPLKFYNRLIRAYVSTEGGFTSSVPNGRTELLCFSAWLSLSGGWTCGPPPR